MLNRVEFHCRFFSADRLWVGTVRMFNVVNVRQAVHVAPEYLDKFNRDQKRSRRPHAVYAKVEKSIITVHAEMEELQPGRVQVVTRKAR